MKRTLMGAGVCLLLLFLLCFPKEALSASREGMSLWIDTLIPTLLPFLILTGILLHTDGIHKLLVPLASFWKKAFGLTPYGAYALLLGWLCGYPMGAKIAADLCSNGKISQREGRYLLTFTNNASPVFLVSYLGQECLKGQASPGGILSILLVSNLCCMLFFRFLIYRDRFSASENCPRSKKETSLTGSLGAITDVSIMNGFETIARLGGYILMFSIASAAISHFWPFHSMGKHFILGIIELTTGLHQISLAPWAYEVKFLASMVFTAFGGLCILAQTRSVINKVLPITPYVCSKCLNALTTLILILVLRNLIR